MKPHHCPSQSSGEIRSHLPVCSAKVPRIVDCMTFRPYTVTAETTVAELLQLFEIHNYDCVPVVEREGRLLGIVTDGDVLRAFEAVQNAAETSVMALPARQFMNSNPVTIHAGETAIEGLRKMSVQRLRWLPVVEADALLGLVTAEQLEARLAEWLPREQAAIAAGLDSFDVQDWLCRT